MKIAVCGAKEITGVHFARQAIQGKHDLKLYCRPQSVFKLGELTSHELVEIVEGGLDDDFTPAIEGVDAVVSFLGPNWSWPTGNPLEKAMIKIMETMRKENVKRFIAMGTASIIDSLDRNSYKMRALVYIASTFASTAYNDIIAVDDLLKCAAESTGRIHTGYIGDEEGSAFCQRADWARFVLTEISEKQWIRKMPLISSV